MITKGQATALSRLVSDLRPDWDFYGVMAAVHRAADVRQCSAFQLAHAALAAAEDPHGRTPAWICEDGPHWGAAAVGHHSVTAGADPRSASVLAQLRQDVDRRDPAGSRRGYLQALAALRAKGDAQ